MSVFQRYNVLLRDRSRRVRLQTRPNCSRVYLLWHHLYCRGRFASDAVEDLVRPDRGEAWRSLELLLELMVPLSF